jgi:hypothetical protein
MAATPIPPAGRPHQITLRATKTGVQYHVIELSTGESPGLGVLSPRDPPVVINVRGRTELRSSSIENLRVSIDGVPYFLPGGLRGHQACFLPDLTTSPPPPPASGARSNR